MKKLSKNKILRLSAVGGLIFILSAGAISVLAYDNTEGNTVQEKIDALLQKLKLSSQQEMKNGQVVSTINGERFSGQSAEKMEKLHTKTQKQIDNLIARTDTERQKAVDEIRKFSKDKEINVDYKNTSKSSLNSVIPVEIYISGLDQYEVNALNNKIIQFGPRPLALNENTKEFDYTSRYSKKELESMARQFLQENAPEVNIDKLTANFGDKDGMSYFFRWEDASREIEGMHPFIQVGFSRGGSLLSYTNSISL